MHANYVCEKDSNKDSASLISPNGMNISILEKQQTTTKIVDLLSSIGKLVRKSTDASVQGMAGISIDYSKLGFLVFVTFAL